MGGWTRSFPINAIVNERCGFTDFGPRHSRNRVGDRSLGSVGRGHDRANSESLYYIRPITGKETDRSLGTNACLHRQLILRIAASADPQKVA